MEFTQEDLENLAILNKELRVRIHSIKKSLKKQQDPVRINTLTKNLKNLVLVNALIEEHGNTRNLYPKRTAGADKKRTSQKA